VKTLDDGAIEHALTERGLDWAHVADHLVKVVKRKNFAEALAFVNVVGALAEERDHHPDIDIRWNTVTLALVSHDAGGITDRDLDLAEAIDGIESASAL
jgi:4a-hydroxytetrahydrobiopterin dehydratase